MNQQNQDQKLPQNYQIQSRNFMIRMNLYAKLESIQVLRVQLQRNLKQQEMFVYEIDQNQLKGNNSLGFFQRPSNLYYEIISAQKDIKVSDFGQISFYVSLGKKSKYMVNLNAVRRRDQIQNQNLYKQYQEEMSKTMQAHNQYMQKITRVMMKAKELKRLNEALPIERKYGVHLEFENYLQNKHLKYNQQVKEAILREMKKQQNQ